MHVIGTCKEYDRQVDTGECNLTPLWLIQHARHASHAHSCTRANPRHLRDQERFSSSRYAAILMLVINLNQACAKHPVDSWCYTQLSSLHLSHFQCLNMLHDPGQQKAWRGPPLSSGLPYLLLESVPATSIGRYDVHLQQHTQHGAQFSLKAPMNVLCTSDSAILTRRTMCVCMCVRACACMCVCVCVVGCVWFCTCARKNRPLAP